MAYGQLQVPIIIFSKALVNISQILFFLFIKLYLPLIVKETIMKLSFVPKIVVNECLKNPFNFALILNYW